MADEHDIIIEAAAGYLKRVLSQVCTSHGIDHARRVAHIAKRAVMDDSELTGTDNALAVRLAALLHDAADRKLFPRDDRDETYQNAYSILAQLSLRGKPLPGTLTHLVIRMIDLVS